MSEKRRTQRIEHLRWHHETSDLPHDLDALEELLRASCEGADANERIKLIPWDETNADFFPNSEALDFSKGKLKSLSALNKILTPDGPMRYMSKSQRGRVHIGDLRTYLKSIPDETDPFELVDDYREDVEKRKAEARSKKPSLE